MNSILWLVAGATVAFVAMRFFNLNGGRGIFVSVLIGCVAAFFGGSVLAPAIADSVIQAGTFNGVSFLIASCTAAAGLYIADTIYERFGA